MNRKQLLIWGGVGVAGVGGYLVFRHHEASSASSSSAASPDSTDPVTGLPYSEDDEIDPATGLTYLAEAQEYGSVAAAEAQASGAAAAGDDAYSGTAGYPTTNVGGSTTTSGSYATNSAWAQAVTAGLTELGYSAADVAAALGLFFAQQPLGSGADGVSYASIIQAAEAEYGPPPQGTYSIIAEPSSGSGGSGSGGTTGTGGGTGTTGGTGGGTTGGTGGGTTAPPVIKTAPSGFRVVNVTGGDNVALAWNAVPGATGYVIAYGPTSGSQEYKQGVSGGGTTSAIVPGVGAGAAGKHYFELWALPAATGGPHAGPIEATTTKSLEGMPPWHLSQNYRSGPLSP
jgi:hypothetical protein